MRPSARRVTVAWALDRSSPIAIGDQLRALAEGAVLGGYDGRRWRGNAAPRDRVRRFVIYGADGGEDAAVAARAALVAGWCNVARELVDAPANLMSPAELGRRASGDPALGAGADRPVQAGLGALAAVGRSSASPPLLLVLRHRPAGAPATPRLALVGKGVTFDTGGYFLKSKSEIVYQKADAGRWSGGDRCARGDRRAGAAAVGHGVRARLREHARRRRDPADRRDHDRIRADREVVNPDAEGRLILADALWYARRDGATHLVDLATLTGDVPDALGDLYGGVFGA